MKCKMGLILMTGLLIAPIAHAETPVAVQIEVNFLLGYLEGSGCEFYRNGTWHDSKAAQEHLRDKYKYLAADNMINTTEDFIEKAASISSFSGKPYQVKCAGAEPVMSNQWLRDELVRLRTF
jgi:Family of unknown function (DUF5329)